MFGFETERQTGKLETTAEIVTHLFGHRPVPFLRLPFVLARVARPRGCQGTGSNCGTRCPPGGPLGEEDLVEPCEVLLWWLEDWLPPECPTPPWSQGFVPRDWA